MENSLFINYLGSSPKIRILDFLLTNREIDFSITDIATNSGVGRATLYRLWDEMVKDKVIMPTRIIGKAKLFKLNTNKPEVKELMKLYDTLILQSLENKKKDAKNRKVVVVGD